MTDAVAALGAKHRSLARDVWQQFWRHKGALGGAAVFTLIALAVLFGSGVGVGVGVGSGSTGKVRSKSLLRTIPPARYVSVSAACVGPI